MANEAKTNETKVKKVKVIIPEDPLNKNNVDVTVQINGKITQIPRGIEVEVDENIKFVLEEAGYLGKKKK